MHSCNSVKTDFLTGNDGHPLVAALGGHSSLDVDSSPILFRPPAAIQPVVCMGTRPDTASTEGWYVNTLLTQATAAKEVRLFDLGPRLRGWFLDARSVLRLERIALERRWVVAGLAAQIVGVAGVFGVYSFVAVQTCEGLLTLGSLVMYFQAVQRASGFLEGLGWSVSSLYESNLFLSSSDEFFWSAVPFAGVVTSETNSQTYYAGSDV